LQTTPSINRTKPDYHGLKEEGKLTSFGIRRYGGKELRKINGRTVEARRE